MGFPPTSMIRPGTEPPKEEGGTPSGSSLGSAPGPAQPPDELEIPEVEPDEDDQADPEPELTDAQAQYHGPEESCETCGYFIGPGACRIVQGPKHPQGHCMLHSTRAGSMVEGFEKMPAKLTPPPVEAQE